MMAAVQGFVFDAAPYMLVVLLGAAAVWDVLYYRIPNWLCLLLALAMVSVGLSHPWGIDWLSHLGGGALMLVFGIALFMVGALGAGDGKLLAAVGLWVGLRELPTVGIYILLAGGALALGLIFVRTMLLGLGTAIPRMGRLRMPAVLMVNQPVPYGVAIAVGTLMATDELRLLSATLI